MVNKFCMVAIIPNSSDRLRCRNTEHGKVLNSCKPKYLNTEFSHNTCFVVVQIQVDNKVMRRYRVQGEVKKNVWSRYQNTGCSGKNFENFKFFPEFYKYSLFYTFSHANGLCSLAKYTTYCLIRKCLARLCRVRPITACYKVCYVEWYSFLNIFKQMHQFREIFNGVA